MLRRHTKSFPDVNLRDSSPELSIVLAARNDQHGEHFLRRLQLFVTGLLEQANLHGLDAELVIVEWNPPDEMPRLRDALTWPKETGPSTLRIIEVPKEVHARYKNAARLSLHQMIGKNVGIRRASGRFVLATTADLLFSDQLVEFLASGTLKQKTMYRIDRYDVRSDVPTNGSMTEKLDYCARNVLRIYGRQDVVSPRAVSLLSYKPRFQIRLPRKLNTLLSRIMQRRFRSAEIPSTSLDLSIRQLMRHFSSSVPVLHLGAPGDFTLLSKEDWFFVRGYPEDPIYPLHIDSILCHIANHNGISEEVLQDPMRIYHIDHEPSWLPPWRWKEKMVAAGIPMLDDSQFIAWLMRIWKEPHYVFANGPEWGLGTEKLDETRV